MEIRLVITDDHPIVRQGLRQAIERDAGLKVLAEAGSGTEALEHIEALRPEVLILDIDMPGMDGFSLAREIRRRGIAIELIFLTIHCEPEYFNEALDLGAKGYVLKDSAVTDIISAIHAVANGKHFTSPALTSYLIDSARRQSATPAPQPGLNALTSSERQILRLLAEYKTSQEIGEQLFISPHTVRTHRKNICSKLGLRGNHALMKFALEHKSKL